MGEQQINQAIQCWPPLAARAGLDADAFDVGEVWQRHDPQRSHIVLRLEGPESAVILKRVFQPNDSEVFRANLLGHRRACAALRGDLLAHAPEILAVDEAGQAVLSTCAPGRTVDALCADGADHGPILRRAGMWMSAFHDATFQEDRQYQPRFMVDHIKRLARALSANERRIRGRAEFLQYAAQIPGWAEGFEGRKTISAAKHGDMNLRNIMLDGDQAWGLDYSGNSHAPVGFDIARFLLNYTEVFGNFDALKPGQVVPPSAFNAFFEGYKAVDANDPSVVFLLKVQLLTDWARVPPESEAENMLHLIRFQRLRKLAGIAFG